MNWKWRKYTELPINIKPLIEGRVPSQWLFNHLHSITKEDFYDFSLSEDDLKKKYSHLKVRG